MAERPNLGGTVGSLDAATAAVRGKKDIADLEKLADEREARLAEQEAAEESAVQKETARSARRKAVREQDTRAVQQESAIVRESDAVLAADTGILDANTAAVERNAAARLRLSEAQRRELAIVERQATPGPATGRRVQTYDSLERKGLIARDAEGYYRPVPLSGAGAANPSIAARERGEAKRAAEQAEFDRIIERRQAQDAAAQSRLAGGQTPEQLYAEDRRRVTLTPGATGDLSRATRAVGADPVVAAKAQAKELGAAERAAYAEEARRTKAEKQALVKELGAAERAAYAEEVRRTKAERLELSRTEARQSLLGAGGGGRGGGLPPVALGGAGGRGGGDGEEPGRIKAVTGAEREATAAERDWNAIRAVSYERQQQSIASMAASSQALQRHGALTSEFIQGLLRGEVTLKEFESQLGVTIGKFAGWAVAGGLVYGAYDAIKHLFTGLSETSSSVDQLKRSLGEKVNVPIAEEGFRRVAQEVNVSIKEVGEAQFYASRVFHDQTQSLELASTALRAYKLDNVNAQDAVKSLGAVSIAFPAEAGTAKSLKTVFDQLDVGQLQFNARLNQTLPQVGRAAASWAAAGGTAKQLVDQIIQINRATGGGGGTGGGNPATALLREPANLTRPESEAVIKKYENVLGFSPTQARANVGAFNQRVQEKAPQLTEADLQEIAKAAGAGAGVGFRYLLPLFRLGRTSLPQQEREATAQASGSAEEDLKHKLDQLDERFKKLGVDLEVFGSKAGGTGISRTLGDATSGVGHLIDAVGLLVKPFASLGAALTEIPAPLRQIIEVAAGYRAVKAIGNSSLGISARSLAGESNLLSYAGGGAPELRALEATNRKFIEDQQNERERAAARSVRAGEKAQAAIGAVQAYQKTPEEVGALSQDEHQAYANRLNVLEDRATTATQAQIDLREKDVQLEAELIRRKLLQATFEDRSIAIQEKLVAAEELRLYAAQLGAPNSAGLLAPDLAAARQLKARREEAALGGLAGSSGPLGKRAAEAQARASEAAATVEGASATGASELAGVTAVVFGEGAANRLESAGAKLGGLATRTTSFFGGLKSLYGKLGVLGKAVGAFAVLSIANELDGANRAQEHGAALLGELQRPTSRTDLEDAIAQSKGANSVGSLLGAEGHDLIAGALHPVQLGESLLNVIGIGGAEHPNTFAFDRIPDQIREAERQRERLAQGKVRFPGEGVTGAALKEYQGEEEENASNLTSTDAKKVEESKKVIEGNLKLRLEQYKAFGGQLGDESLKYLVAEVTALANEYRESGNQVSFEELVNGLQQVETGIEQRIKARVGVRSKRIGLGGHPTKEANKLKAESEKDRAKESEGLADSIAAGDKAEYADNLEYYRLKFQYTNANKTTKRKLRPGLEAARHAAETKQKNNQNLKQYKEQSDEQHKIDKADEEVALFTAEFATKRAALTRDEASPAISKAKIASKRAALAAEEAGHAATKLLSAFNVQVIADAVKKAAAEAEAAVAAKDEEIEQATAFKIARLPANATGATEADIRAQAAKETLAARRAEGLKGKQLKPYELKSLEASRQAAQTRESEAEKGGSGKTDEQKQKHQEAKEKYEERERRAEERINAKAELDESKTQDPIKQAKIELRKDKELLPHTKGVAHTRELAAINRDEFTRTEAIVKGREEDIDFNKTMEKISTDQAIRQYRALLKVHGLSKQTRRDILTKIKSLQDETTPELNVGDIRLPTLFDAKNLRSLAASASARAREAPGVPRIVAEHPQPTTGGEPGGPGVKHHADAHAAVVQTNHNTFYLTVPDGNPHKIAHAIESALGTTGRAHLRTSGLS